MELDEGKKRGVEWEEGPALVGGRVCRYVILKERISFDLLDFTLLPEDAGWTVSRLLPQPATTDGRDSSLRINETTNLPDNIPSFGSLAEAAGSLLIIPLCLKKKEKIFFKLDQFCLSKKRNLAIW